MSFVQIEDLRPIAWTYWCFAFQVFAEFFDKVIDERHGGYKPWDKHPTDLDYTKIKGGSFDEKWV